MMKKFMKFTSIVFLLFIFVGCGNKKEFKSDWMKFEDTSVRPKYIEKKKSDNEIWLAFDYRNDFSQKEKVGFISKMIDISAIQNEENLQLSQETEDDFSDSLSSVYQEIAKGEENLIIYKFKTEDFKNPVKFVFKGPEEDEKEITIEIN